METTRTNLSECSLDVTQSVHFRMVPVKIRDKLLKHGPECEEAERIVINRFYPSMREVAIMMLRSTHERGVVLVDKDEQIRYVPQRSVGRMVVGLSCEASTCIAKELDSYDQWTEGIVVIVHEDCCQVFRVRATNDRVSVGFYFLPGSAGSSSKSPSATARRGAVQASRRKRSRTKRMKRGRTADELSRR